MGKKEEQFQGRYQVADGYAGGARPQYVSIDAGDLDDEMTDEELETFYVEVIEEDFRQNIMADPERVEEFVAWAREKLAERDK